MAYANSAPGASVGLANSKSPYLIQHASDPVRWLPWGPEAHNLAKSQDRPIFLSVGYSTCHWCHVMQRESFKDAKVAQVLNERFVCVKVDREERPDIDRVYMMFLSMTTRTAGWPMTIFLTPDLIPIVGATYMPPVDSPQGQGLVTLASNVAEKYQTTKDEVVAQSKQILENMRQTQKKEPEKVVLKEDTTKMFLPIFADRLILKCVDDFEGTFDQRFGGFNVRPKFPTPVSLMFLATASARLMQRVRMAAKQFKELEDEAGEEAAPTPAPEPPVEMGDPNKVASEEDQGQAMELRGEAQGAFGENQEAGLELITKAIKTNPAGGSLYAVRAQFLLQMGRPVSAINDCDVAIKLNPDYAKSYKVRGKARIKLSQWEGAAADLAKANQLDYDEDTYELLSGVKERAQSSAAKRKAREDVEKQRAQIGITEGKASFSLHMMMFTLHCISHGGLNDHIGGGFSRYSVDEFWHVPHFEKMLYDNAQLACAFCIAVQVDRRAHYVDAVRSTLKYAQRDMLHAEGGFFGAEDADSAPATGGAAEEGAYYTWKYDDVCKAVQHIHPKAAEVVTSRYGAIPEGNIRQCSDPHGALQGKNVLFLDKPIEAVVESSGLSLPEVTKVLQDSQVALEQFRSQRPRPHKDDKVITAWNGLMISAFARAWAVLGDAEYLTTARKAITFVRQKLYDDPTVTLWRSFREGKGDVPGFHTDYTFFIQGLLDTYVGTGNAEMLRWALKLQDKAHELFGDTSNEGAYYDSSPKDDVLIRMKEDHDGAEPTANSVTCMNLWTLGKILQRPDLLERAQRILLAMEKPMSTAPRSACNLLLALSLFSQQCIQFAVCGEPNTPETLELMGPVLKNLIPNKVITYVNHSNDIFTNTTYLKGLEKKGGKATVHVFVDYEKRAECVTADEVTAVLGDLSLIWGPQQVAAAAAA